mgnify:CR=1 FL=1
MAQLTFGIQQSQFLDFLTALLQQARYEYNQGIRGKELDNRLKAAQVNLVGAQTGKAIADTAETTALLPGKVEQVDDSMNKLESDNPMGESEPAAEDEQRPGEDAAKGDAKK